MRRSTKGAIAAAAAAVLLLGGGTTLAYWTATGTVDGGTITAGELKLTPVACADTWLYAPGSAGAGTAVTAWVPGDVVTKSCSFTVEATGDNLAATLTAPTTVTLGGTVPTSGSASVATTYTIGGTAIANGGTVTDANDGQTLVASFQVTFPFGTDETGTPVVNGNATQLWAAELDDLTVTLTQTNPN
jgi:alternate signal-mediated exported protein